jgi:hypothetical protein
MPLSDLIEQDIREAGERLTRLQWLGASVLLGLFLGFVDTLTVACVLGYLKLQVPAFVGVPTTFSGYFFSGFFVGKLAPPRIKWEAPIGILICVLAFMAGYAGFTGQGPIQLTVHYGILPAAAVGICYVGVEGGRRGIKSLWRELRAHRVT